MLCCELIIKKKKNIEWKRSHLSLNPIIQLFSANSSSASTWYTYSKERFLCQEVSEKQRIYKAAAEVTSKAVRKHLGGNRDLVTPLQLTEVIPQLFKLILTCLFIQAPL